MTGKVYLVGAGPGDPELITVRGVRALREAEVVLYDHLANASLLEYSPAAERIYVGKKRSAHSHTQEQIIELMLDRARQGKTVVRLKGGDPFLFGRGGEEVEALAGAGIAFQVVPGITAPLGIAAYTGVPLTHRDHTSVVTFVTGHDVSRVDWSKVGTAETLVVYMGLHYLREIVDAIIDNGRSPDTPAMAVRWGTRPDQQTVSGTLAELPGLVQEHGMVPPATVIIGEVVRLRQKIDWFERLPLFGKRIVLTRPQDQAHDLAQALRDLGAEPVHLPVIELAPLDDYSVLDAAIRKLEEYDWIVFTSVNAVDYFLDRLNARGRDMRAVRARLCAIGPATKAALEAIRLHVDLAPEEHHSEGVAAAFRTQKMAGTRVLLPRAAAAREVIPAALREMGACVDVADAYRNVVPAGAEERVRAYFDKERKPDWITFTSGSTVKNLLAMAGADSLKGVRIASIGPATSDMIRMHGLEVHAEADPSSAEGLVQAILRATARQNHQM